MRGKRGGEGGERGGIEKSGGGGGRERKGGVRGEGEGRERRGKSEREREGGERESINRSGMGVGRGILTKTVNFQVMVNGRQLGVSFLEISSACFPWTISNYLSGSAPGILRHQFHTSRSDR